MEEALTPLRPHRKEDREEEGTSRAGGDTVPDVTHSSESTRSYRRISGMVGKVGSAGSPQSPGGPEDPALSKMPPVPMPRRFAPVGANPPLCIPKHPSSSYPGVADGMIRGSYPCCCLLGGLRGFCHPLFIPFQTKGRQKRVKAVADCKGDKARELTFSKGEVIVVTREEDEQIWVSHHGTDRCWDPNPGPFPPPVLF